MKQPTAIITGAAGGIGAAMAEKFAKEGYALALVDNNIDKLHILVQKLTKIHDDHLLLAGDLASDEFLASICEQVTEKFGRIDVLINNAAWRTRETLRTISVDDWNRTIKVCLTAPAFLTKYAAAQMERHKIDGVIINISSIQSELAGGVSPAYTICKGGIESLTFESAVLYGPKGIRVICISPGNINTSISNDFKDEAAANISKVFNEEVIDNTPLQRGGEPSEIAAAAYWLCSGEASFITGTNIIIDGGYSHNFIPYRLKKIQLNKEF